MKFIKLKEVCKFIGGSQPPAKYFSNQKRSEYVRLIQIRDFESDDKAVYIPKNMAKRICSEDDVMIARYGGYNNYKTLFKILRGKSGSYNVALIKTVPDEDKISKGFLYFVLQHPHLKEEIIRKSSRAVQSGFTKDDLNNLEIPLPSLSDQKRMEEILKNADALRERRKEADEISSSLIQAIFLEIFGDPQTNPKKWRVQTLGEFISILTDYHANGSYEILRNHVKMTDERGYAIMVRSTDLESNNFELDNKHITEEAYNFLAKTKLYGGEILINKIGSAGKVYFMPYLNKPVSLGMNLFLLRFSELLNNIYVYHYLISHHGQSILNRKAQGAVTKTITKKEIRTIPIMLPPIELQQKFADLVQKVEKIKEKQEESKKELGDLFNSLMQKIFNKG